MTVQAGKVKPLAPAGSGGSPIRAVDAGGEEVRFAACVRAWAAAEQTITTLEAGFAAILAEKQVNLLPGANTLCSLMKHQDT